VNIQVVPFLKEMFYCLLPAIFIAVTCSVLVSRIKHLNSLNLNGIHLLQNEQPYCKFIYVEINVMLINKLIFKL
jgi:hypothetical protein